MTHPGRLKQNTESSEDPGHHNEQPINPADINRGGDRRCPFLWSFSRHGPEAGINNTSGWGGARRGGRRAGSGDIDPFRVLGSARMLGTACRLAGSDTVAIMHTVDILLLAYEVGNRLRILGRVWRLAAAADTAVREGFL